MSELMIGALVIEADAANRLSLGGFQLEDSFSSWESLPSGVAKVSAGEITYLIGNSAALTSRLLVISGGSAGFLSTLPSALRLECFNRILRAALSQFRPNLVKIPLEWRVFHSGSLISFQANRVQTGNNARVYLDVAPEGTRHVYAFHVSISEKEPLTRAASNANAFIEAVIGYESALTRRNQATPDHGRALGHPTIALTETFSDANIAQGIPFHVWRDAKLTRQQREFFDTQFDGPLRVKGPAGSGKTLVLAMRFLKEIYARIDTNEGVRACFLAHAEETADHITKYLIQIDERGVITDPERYPNVDIEITTLHGLANRYISRDTDNIQPLSLDGSEGRQLQFELVRSLVASFVSGDWTRNYKEGCRSEFTNGIESPSDRIANRAFCYDLSDEFANVLETFGVRGIDDIRPRYFKAKPAERSLARNAAEKFVVFELYRRFRQSLADMDVVSLDQFTADFLAYLNSFRWDALRRERGFDFVFADELHLFNSQERRVLGYLLRESEPPRRVAVAYDPRQSPRNSFFPEAATERDTIWTEAKLDSSMRPVELTDVFRYSPEILAFLDRLNQQFPANDLAEDWSIKFGSSHVASGPIPIVKEFAGQFEMIRWAAEEARALANKSAPGEHVGILCLDYERFSQYRRASLFDKDFVVVGGRDELGLIGRYRRRAVLSMPEYVAGLQFRTVIIVDANANLVAELGGGVNGLHRFISTVYLGASRAKQRLDIYADRSAGGMAGPIRDAVTGGVVSVST